MVYYSFDKRKSKHLGVSTFRLRRQARLSLASFFMLAIIAPATGAGNERAAIVKKQYSSAEPLGGARVFGRIESVNGSGITLSLRSGKTVRVDLTTATENQLTIHPNVGEYVRVEGHRLPDGNMNAESMIRVKNAPTLWEQDIN